MRKNLIVLTESIADKMMVEEHTEYGSPGSDVVNKTVPNHRQK
ncbi:MAG: hypothetical protein ACYTBV_06700 [Planctomycetota bacterium]